MTRVMAPEYHNYSCFSTADTAPYARNNITGPVKVYYDCDELTHTSRILYIDFPPARLNNGNVVVVKLCSLQCCQPCSTISGYLTHLTLKIRIQVKNIQNVHITSFGNRKTYFANISAIKAQIFMKIET